MLLVTGSAGFIGSNFCHYYLKKYKHSHIVGVDKLTYVGDMCNIDELTDNKRFHFVKGDIANSECIDLIFDEYDISGVINFAAETHVDRSILDASSFIRSNIFGTFTLLECVKRYLENGDLTDEFKYVQISTDEVYGSTDNNKFVETTLLHPNNPYSASKASADLLVSSYYNTYKFPATISRCSNNFGPRQHTEKFIPMVITNALTHKFIPIYGDGNQVRDWIFVDDHCSAIDCILQHDCNGEIFNVGGDNEWRNIDIALLIIQYLQDICEDSAINNNLINYVQDRPGHDRRYAMDATKIKQTLGWEPSVKFEDGLKLTIDWYIDHLTVY